MERISLRQARTFLAIAETLSFTAAAEVLMRSQTSVTKTIQELEKQLGFQLFERSLRGVTVTVFGQALLPHLKEASIAFKKAEQFIPPRSLRESAGIARFFAMDVSDHWLDAFVAVCDHGGIAAAASHLCVTHAAVSSSLRKLEDSLNISLLERTPAALLPTPLGRALLEHVKLARNHLRSTQDAVLSLQGVQRGKVRVGTLPFIQTIILPRAIVRLLAEHPELDISTVEGSYDELTSALRCGDIDFVVGALRGEEAGPMMSEERLLDDHLSVIVKKGHPLENKEVIGWEDLLGYSWILPLRGTRIYELFARAMRRRGLDLPTHFIETSSFATMRSVLLESERVTISSHHQIFHEENLRLLTTLPFDLQDTNRPIGITRRLHGLLSPAVGLLIQRMREVTAEFHRD